MLKVKIFYNPIEQLPIFLNKLAQQGYRLESVYNCFYSFKKTDTKVNYSVQFIGYDSNSKNQKYIDMLKDAGFKTFRAPLNQLNFAFGKIRLRPLASGSAKVATSFDNYNKEILIVESEGDISNQLLSTNSDKELYYKKLRNVYIHGLIMILFLAGIVIYGLYKLHFNMNLLMLCLSFIIILLLIFVLIIIIKFSNKYQKFAKESKFRE